MSYCHKRCHIQKFIFFRKRRINVCRKKKDGNNRVSSISNDLFIVDCEYKVNLFLNDEFIWVIHNGASIHVTLKKELFIYYTPYNFGVFKMVIDGLAKVISVGDIFFETNIKMKLLLKDVRHTSDVHLNFVSVKRLDNEDFVNTFSLRQ
ncbi:hypothetical protein AHAS_Ahas15G0238000 [Arachis hypogaea]